jgi:hypothetical protein
MFSESGRDEAIRLLREDCTADALHSSTMSPAELERCHFAVLKLSNGSLESLINAISLAQTDYRDLLVAADFGEDLHAHLQWFPAEH